MEDDAGAKLGNQARDGLERSEHLERHGRSALDLHTGQVSAVFVLEQFGELRLLLLGEILGTFEQQPRLKGSRAVSTSPGSCTSHV